MPEMDFLELADEVRRDNLITHFRKVEVREDRTSKTDWRGRKTKDVMGRQGASARMTGMFNEKGAFH